ncbi:MAG: hypothetical protein JNL11_06475 [Bdellovibrionaceae bacterium]|nr:hypothetical protein [Pseudobdellovibrionaceae bacterium]
MNLPSLNEFADLQSHIKNFSRSPKQTHNFFHSDAEVLQLANDSFLAISLDIVGDEQAWGLIQDPKNLGRHALETALSDLAAVGVSPAGFLQGLVIGQNHDSKFIEGILNGLNNTAQKHRLFLYGGDTASGQVFSLHLNVVGHSRTKPLSRLGMGTTDKIYTTQKPGKGNALVAHRVMDKNHKLDETPYLAQARIPESQIIKNYATCMIDSSDGFLNSLDLLVRVNNIGISCTSSLDAMLNPLALAAAQAYNISPWALLAGEFGDYELIFSVPESKSAEFEKKYEEKFSNLVEIGIAIEPPELQLTNSHNKVISYDASIARNLYRELSETKPEHYLTRFLELGKNLGF